MSPVKCERSSNPLIDVKRHHVTVSVSRRRRNLGKPGYSFPSDEEDTREGLDIVRVVLVLWRHCTNGSDVLGRRLIEPAHKQTDLFRILSMAFWPFVCLSRGASELSMMQGRFALFPKDGARSKGLNSMTHTSASSIVELIRMLHREPPGTVSKHFITMFFTPSLCHLRLQTKKKRNLFQLLQHTHKPTTKNPIKKKKVTGRKKSLTSKLPAAVERPRMWQYASTQTLGWQAEVLKQT